MPRRRCVGCGRIAPKAELLRLAIVRDGEGNAPRAVSDTAAVMPGRGAYLCRGSVPADADAACVQSALRRGGVSRALRCKVTLDPKLVESVSR